MWSFHLLLTDEGDSSLPILFLGIIAAFFSHPEIFYQTPKIERIGGVWADADVRSRVLTGADYMSTSYTVSRSITEAFYFSFLLFNDRLGWLMIISVGAMEKY